MTQLKRAAPRIFMETYRVTRAGGVEEWGGRGKELVRAEFVVVKRAKSACRVRPSAAQAPQAAACPLFQQSQTYVRRPTPTLSTCTFWTPPPPSAVSTASAANPLSSQ